MRSKMESSLKMTMENSLKVLKVDSSLKVLKMMEKVLKMTIGSSLKMTTRKHRKGERLRETTSGL